MLRLGVDFRRFCRISPRFRPLLDIDRIISYVITDVYEIMFVPPWGIFYAQNRYNDILVIRLGR